MARESIDQLENDVAAVEAAMGVLSDWPESNAQPISPVEIRALVNDQRFPMSPEAVSQEVGPGSDLPGHGGLVDEFDPLPE